MGNILHIGVFGLFICQSKAKPKEIQASLLLNSAKVNIAAGKGLFRFILQPETTGRNNDALSLCITLGCIGVIGICNGMLPTSTDLFIFHFFVYKQELAHFCVPEPKRKCKTQEGSNMVI